MFSKVFAFFLIITLLVLITFKQTVANQNERVQYERVESRNRLHKCKHPQPRTVRTKDILRKNMIRLHDCEKIVPSVTVLHKCDFGTGCCDRDNTCQPETTKEVPLVFAVIRMQHGIGYYCAKDPNISQSVKYLEVLGLNHTSCACQSPKNLPK